MTTNIPDAKARRKNMHESARGHLMVVEDEQDLQDLIRFNLERNGFRVSTSESGEKAIRMIHEDPPDLILLDLMLPGMDGLEFCKLVKADQDLAEQVNIITEHQTRRGMAGRLPQHHVDRWHPPRRTRLRIHCPSHLHKRRPRGPKPAPPGEERRYRHTMPPTERLDAQPAAALPLNQLLPPCRRQSWSSCHRPIITTDPLSREGGSQNAYETVDQPRLTAKLELESARSSASFRKLQRSIESLCSTSR